MLDCYSCTKVTKQVLTTTGTVTTAPCGFYGKVRGWNQYPPTVSISPIHHRLRNTLGTLTERWQMDPSCPLRPPLLESMSPWCRHLGTDIYILWHHFRQKVGWTSVCISRSVCVSCQGSGWTLQGLLSARTRLVLSPGTGHSIHHTSALTPGVWTRNGTLDSAENPRAQTETEQTSVVSVNEDYTAVYCWWRL